MMNHAMSQTLEIAFLHLQLLNDCKRAVFRNSDFTFLYFFPVIFKDLYNILDSQMNINYSFAIAFPEICQEFVGCLHKLCPEEYEVG